MAIHLLEWAQSFLLLQSNAVPAELCGLLATVLCRPQELYPSESGQGHPWCQVLQPVRAALTQLHLQAPALCTYLRPSLRSSQLRRMWWGQSPSLCGH